MRWAKRRNNIKSRAGMGHAYLYSCTIYLACKSQCTFSKDKHIISPHKNMLVFWGKLLWFLSEGGKNCRKKIYYWCSYAKKVSFKIVYCYTKIKNCSFRNRVKVLLQFFQEIVKKHWKLCREQGKGKDHHDHRFCFCFS